MPELPIIDDFFIPRLGYTLVDRRRLSEEGRQESDACRRRFLIDELEAKVTDPRREQMGLCEDQGDRQRKYMAMYTERLSQEPSLSYEEWEAEGHTIEYDHDHDPRLSHAYMTAMCDGLIVGQVPIRNAIVKEENDERVQISAMGTPALGAAPGISLAVTWATIYKSILERNLILEDGRTLDVYQWRWPTDHPAYRFTPQPWNHMGEMFDEIRTCSPQEERSRYDEDCVYRMTRSDVEL